ncbi:hypothetical protein [Cellulomonas sp. P5_C6]
MTADMCYASGINPYAIPGADLDPDGVIAAANALGTGGGAVRDAGADVVGKWRGLAAHYEAPEAAQLFTVMDPVEASARDFGDAVAQVAVVLRAYAEEIRPIKASLAAVKRDAYAFRDKIASNSDWEYDQDLVDENTDLIGRVNSAQVTLWDAERTCANGIRALYCAAPWHAMTSEHDPLGYGVAEIPDDAAMAWGSSVERKDHCPKSAAVGVKEFVWDGLVVDGLGGTLVGLGAMVGIQDWSWSWDTMKTTWGAMGGLIGLKDGQWSWGTAGDSWTALGKGLISYDAWEDGHGARGAGGAIFNIGTFFIPVAGQAAGVVKGGALAAKAGRVATWLEKGARIADFVDPVALALKGGKIVLPKMGDLLGGLRGATEGLGDALKVPDVPTTFDLPTSSLDNIADGVPPVRDPADLPPVHEPVEVPAPVNHQLVGPDGNPIHDTTPGGTGTGGDDLAGSPKAPTDPVHAPSTDTPTGGSHDPGPTGGTTTAPGPAHPGGPSGPVTDPAPPTGGTGGGTPGTPPDPERVYTMADGTEHHTAYAPEQVPAHNAAQVIDSVLADPDVFARHGVAPWTHDHLVQVVMTPIGDLTPPELAVLREIDDALPPPSAGDAVQKVLDPTDLQNILNGSMTQLGGSVARLEDVVGLSSVEHLHDALRLDYPKTPFTTDADSFHALRFEATQNADISRNSLLGGNGSTDTWADPYTGNGFLKSPDLIPEYRLPRADIPAGAEIWEFTRDGTQRLYAAFDGSTWIRVAR